MNNIIIRRQNFFGNAFAGIIILFSWLFILAIITLSITTQWHIYSDDLVVLDLLLNINIISINHGLQVVMICFTLVILPLLVALLSSNGVDAYVEKK